MPAKPFDATVNLSLPSRIAIIGNYLPRQCGIATFTTDLCDAISTEFGTERLFALPVNDPESEYDYPERVRFELTEEELASYDRAAEFLNFTNVDLVCVQHEYGIFGGPAGSHILELLRQTPHAHCDHTSYSSARTKSRPTSRDGRVGSNSPTG